MTAVAPTDGLTADDLFHVDPKLFHPKMRSSMMRVTVALTQSVLAAWDTCTHRLWLLWEVSDIVVVNPDPKQGSDDLALVMMKKSSNVQVSLLPLTHQLHPLSNWQGEGSASSSAEWRARIDELVQFHNFVRTFQPPSWPFRNTPLTIELPQLSSGSSIVVAVAPNIVWLLTEPGTIVIVHLSLQKEIGRVKVPIERPNCVTVGDGVVVLWSGPTGGSGFEPNEGSMLQIFRSSDCCMMVQKCLPIHAVRSCCVLSGFIWAVTMNGVVVVISFRGVILQEFDFRLQGGVGALSICTCPLVVTSLCSSDVPQSGVMVAFEAGAFEYVKHQFKVPCSSLSSSQGFAFSLLWAKTGSFTRVFMEVYFGKFVLCSVTRLLLYSVTWQVHHDIKWQCLFATSY
jgi:hypothetical protein